MPLKTMRGDISTLRAEMEAFGVISQEIQSPLAAIRTTSDLLRVYFDVLSIQRHNELFDVLNRSTTRLVVLFDDLLLASRLENAQIAIRHEVVEADALAREALFSAQNTYPERTFSGVFADGEYAVRTDRMRALQVLGNLLSNAVKYSYRNSVIALSVEPGDGWMKYTVENEGPGIDASSLPRIFTRFGKVDDVDDGSVGLGLYISRQLVELMGGTIDFSSTRGERTAFWFSLPRARKKN